MKTLTYLFFLCILFLLSACDDQFSDDLVRDNKPTIPLTYLGSSTNGFNPYYTVSIEQGGAVEIQLSIPANSGRTIKEITKVIAGGTSINAGNVADTARKSYISAPIPGSSTNAIFTTSITEFNSKLSATSSDRIPAAIAANTPGASIIQTVPLPTPFIERAFMFIVTLDDNSTIIPVQCRIRVTQ